MFAEAGTAPAALLDDTAYAQPGLYALQCGLWALWCSLGLEAEAVLGHSVGEYAAAHAAGVLELEAGARLVARRGALMAALQPGGAMASVFAPAEEVAAALARCNAGTAGPGLSLAAENGTHRVVSGPAPLVDGLLAQLAAAGVHGQRLRVSHAFHSALMDPVLAELEAVAAEIRPQPAQLALVSNLTGAPFAVGTWPDATYWRRHAREPVRFAAGVATLAGFGIDALLELGPRAVLAPLALGCWPDGVPAPAAAASLRPGVADDRALAEAAAALYATGAAIDLSAREASRGYRRVSLPTYPFEPQRHWVNTAYPQPPLLVDTAVAPASSPRRKSGAPGPGPPRNRPCPRRLADRAGGRSPARGTGFGFHPVHGAACRAEEPDRPHFIPGRSVHRSHCGRHRPIDRAGVHGSASR